MKKWFSTANFCFSIFVLFCLALWVEASAQEDFAQVKISYRRNSAAQVEIKFPKADLPKSALFLQNYADVENLSSRITNLKLKNKENQEISFNKLSNGEILSDYEIASISYDINLSIPQNTLSTAHVSWVSNDQGLLMLNDLLPHFEDKQPIYISFSFPGNWKISTSEKQIREKFFEVKDVSNAVFFVGNEWQEESFTLKDSEINISMRGEWNFHIKDAVNSTEEILKEYEKIFGELPRKKISLYILRFPRPTDFERWRAETRGSNLVILSSPTAFKTQEIQRLHEQLRHELFHLWIPNNLNLTGDFAWFYEGFTQYASLSTGVKLNRISFSDFLNTLEQAVNIRERRSQTISLLDASKIRWASESSRVYADGMLLAFLCDAALLRESGGKTNLLEIFRKIYQKHRLNENKQDGNTAVLQVLREYESLNPIIDHYITGANKIRYSDELKDTGIEFLPVNYGYKLQVKTKLSGREKDLLDKLGYNNWRKILKNPK